MRFEFTNSWRRTQQSCRNSVHHVLSVVHGDSDFKHRYSTHPRVNNQQPALYLKIIMKHAYEMVLHIISPSMYFESYFFHDFGRSNANQMHTRTNAFAVHRPNYWIPWVKGRSAVTVFHRCSLTTVLGWKWTFLPITPSVMAASAWTSSCNPWTTTLVRYVTSRTHCWCRP